MDLQREMETAIRKVLATYILDSTTKSSMDREIAKTMDKVNKIISKATQVEKIPNQRGSAVSGPVGQRITDASASGSGNHIGTMTVNITGQTPLRPAPPTPGNIEAQDLSYSPLKHLEKFK